jgi:hypothetical protein
MDLSKVLSAFSMADLIELHAEKSGLYFEVRKE